MKYYNKNKTKNVLSDSYIYTIKKIIHHQKIHYETLDDF